MNVYEEALIKICENKWKGTKFEVNPDRACSEDAAGTYAFVVSSNHAMKLTACFTKDGRVHVRDDGTFQERHSTRYALWVDDSVETLDSATDRRQGNRRMS